MFHFKKKNPRFNIIFFNLNGFTYLFFSLHWSPLVDLSGCTISLSQQFTINVTMR